MTGGFNGFSAAAFTWFEGLQDDNSKRWFDDHRDVYHAEVRGALEAMLGRLADEGGGRVRMFRQHRDTRFSADKSPYKTQTYGVVIDRLASEAPLYAQLSSGGLMAGTGYYGMAADQLTRFRAAVDAGRAGEALAGIVDGVRAAGVEVFGEALKTAPRGWPRDHPRVQLLRHRSLFAGLRLRAAPGGAIAAEAALSHARMVYDACGELNAWLDEHVGPTSEAPRSRPGR